MSASRREAQALVNDEEEEEFSSDDDDEVLAGKEAMQKLCEIALGDEETKILHDAPQDTWGVMLYVILKDIGDIVEGDVSCARVFRVMFSMLAMVMNIGLQFAVLFWVFEYVVTPSVANIQQQYADFHHQAYDANGVFNRKGWDSFPSEFKDSLCQAGLSQPVFLGGILFLWTLAMLVEFRENFNLNRHLMEVAILPKGIHACDQVLEQTDDGTTTFLLVAMQPVTRAIIYLLIVIPKYIIIMLLTFIGWRWLSSSESFSDLILNSLALQFICTIDELIFTSVFPEKMTERIANFKIAVPKKQYEDDKQKAEAEEKEIIFLYSRALCFLLIASCGLASYILVFQNVLPGYAFDLKSTCALEGALPLRCKFMARDCFPMGPAAPTLAPRLLGVGEI